MENTIYILGLLLGIIYLLNKFKKEDFRWMHEEEYDDPKENDQEDVQQKEDVHVVKYNRTKKNFECNTNFGCWYPQNFKLPRHNRVPYNKRFTYTDTVWNYPQGTVPYDSKHHIFLY